MEDSRGVLVEKAVRAMLKSLPTPANCGKDAMQALNVKMKALITEAAARASGNGRKTLKPVDV